MEPNQSQEQDEDVEIDIEYTTEESFQFSMDELQSAGYVPDESSSDNIA